jgi:PAS domain S-box-containing protein
MSSPKPEPQAAQQDLLAELAQLRKRCAEIEEILRNAAALTPEALSIGDPEGLTSIEDALRQVSVVGVFRTDLEGNCIAVNEQWCSITGIARADALARGWLRVLVPEDRERFLRDPPRFAVGRSYRGEYRYRRPDGRVVWIESHSVVETDPVGQPKGVLSTILDITARKDAERLAAESRLRAGEQLAELETIYQHTPVGLCLIDGDLRYRRVNDLMARWNSLPAADHIGRRVAEVVSSESRKRVVAMLERVLRTGQSVVGYQAHGFPPSDPGHRYEFQVNLHPVKGAGGAVERIIAVVQDITVLKRTQAELRLLQRRLAEAQQVAGVGSWEWNVLEDKMWLSDELYRLFGRERGSFTPSWETFVEQVHPGDRVLVRRQLEEVLACEGPVRARYRIIVNGNTRRMSTRARIERTPDGRPARLIGTTRDVTDD